MPLLTQCGRSRDGILHCFTLNAKAELIDPASDASAQLMRDLVGRYVVLQAAGIAQKALQHAGAPRSPLSHTVVSASLHAGATGEPKAFPCLDVLNNARTNFNEPLLDGGEVRLVEGLVSGMVQGAECNPVEGLVLGAVTNAPLGRFTRITRTS